MFKKIIYAILILLILFEISHINNTLFLINENLKKINSNVEQAQGTWEDNQNFDI